MISFTSGSWRNTHFVGNNTTINDDPCGRDFCSTHWRRHGDATSLTVSEFTLQDLTYLCVRLAMPMFAQILLSQTAGYRLMVAEHVSRNIWKKVCEYLVEIRWNRDLDIIFKEEWMEHLVKYVWWEIIMLINRRYYSEGVVRKLLWSKNWNNTAGMVSKQYKDWKSYWWFPIEIQ